jgi:hypothetical protein
VGSRRRDEGAGAGVLEVEAELLGLVCRVEGRRHQPGARHGQEAGQVLQAIAQHESDARAGLQPAGGQHGGQGLDLFGQGAEGSREAVFGPDHGGMVHIGPAEEVGQRQHRGPRCGLRGKFSLIRIRLSG